MARIPAIYLGPDELSAIARIVDVVRLLDSLNSRTPTVKVTYRRALNRLDELVRILSARLREDHK